MHLLSGEQLAHYRKHHWLHAPGVVSADALALMRRILEAWADRQVREWVAEGLLSDPMEDVPFDRRLNEAWVAAGKPQYQRSPRRALLGHDIYDLLQNTTIVDLAADLLETEDIATHGVYNARPKLPDQLWTDTPWHQDAQYYPDAEHAHVLSIWMPLQHVTEHNSCMQVASGYHQLRPAHDDASGFIGFSPQDSEPLEPVTLPMAPGDALCFWQLTPHRAVPNRSGDVRWSMDVRYEPLAQRTAWGSSQGMTARGPDGPTSYEDWLTQWESIPASGY